MDNNGVMLCVSNVLQQFNCASAEFSLPSACIVSKCASSKVSDGIEMSEDNRGCNKREEEE